jgi:hypothetical protein
MSFYPQISLKTHFFVMSKLNRGRKPRPSKNKAPGAATEQINAVPEDLKIVLRPLESLLPFARNPRTQTEEQVA